MSTHGSKRSSSSASTIRSKSTRRSSSNLALIQEQSTPPTASPKKESSSSSSPTDSPEHYDDTSPLNPDSDTAAKILAAASMLPGMEEGMMKDDKSGRRGKLVPEEEGSWIQYARIILPHVGMVMLCVLYAVAGATVFYFVERPQEVKIRTNNLQALRRSRDTFLRDLWQMSIDQSVTKNDFRRAAFEKSDHFVKRLFESLEDGQYMSPAAFNRLISESTIFNDDPTRPSVKPTGKQSKTTATEVEDRLSEIEALIHRNDTSIPDMWSFVSSLFFAAATLTTVGYGYTTPVTATGRLLCVSFGLLGIPLTLMTIADIGKFLGEGLKRLYGLWTKVRRHFGSCMGRCFRCCKSTSPSEEEGAKVTDEENGNVETKKDDNDKEEKNSPGSKKEEKEEEEKNGVDKNTKDEAKAAEELAANVSATLPLEWIFVTIVAYTLLGAGLFHFIEPWSLMESFYFCFITMTTVGYGDFVPLNQTYFALTLLYIVLGLAITTMSIDQAASEYIRKIHYFGRKIQRAKAALSHVKNMISYANWIKRRYGLTDQQIRAMTHLPGFFGRDMYGTSGAYVPYCYRRLYFIDQRTDSMLEEIFTITTTESDEQQTPGAIDEGGEGAMAETDVPSRRVTVGGSLDYSSLTSHQYREGGWGGWSRMRRRMVERRAVDRQSRASTVPRSVSMDVTCFGMQRTPITSRAPRFPGMTHLERIAAIQRMRRTASADFYGIGTRPSAFDQMSATDEDGRGLVDGIAGRAFGANNNDHSPTKANNDSYSTSTTDARTPVNKPLAVIPMDELDRSLISL